MLEKILQKLKEQRGQTSSVSDRSLEDLAKTLSVYITTDDLLTAADFTVTIKSIEGNINHVSAEAVKKTATIPKPSTKTPTPSSKKSKKDSEEEETEEEEVSKKDPNEVPPWAEKIMKTLENLQNEKTINTRFGKLNETLKGLPPYYSKPILSGFQKMSFETDEEFESYLLEIKTNNTTFQQAAREQGLNVTIPASTEVKLPKDNGETETLASAREVIQKAKEKIKV